MRHVHAPAHGCPAPGFIRQAQRLMRRGQWEGRGQVVLYEIVAATAHPDHTVSITWSDGARGVVDFLPIIDRGGWFTPLRDPDWFVSTMVLLPGGIGSLLRSRR